ncbi:hypothetical protein GGR51DRAFT_184852 [Nemania sp. FL0031]|nr:hypothetical protein GGR51DRAFT_184852 [Nemania sp. FL0031]
MQSSALTTHTQSSTTTAAVREHTCLFTHDLRRKQKRWQDGRLKYHTFNRRVMVYDQRGNFVGDAHWREDYDLGDGDEIELERGAVIIQVGECVGSRDQDLSELIDKRAQERAQRQAAASASAAARRPSIAPATPLHVIKPQSLPQKHLHAVIGTPSGHHGRAVLPRESPYEERQQKQALESDDARPAKRQRREISPPSKGGYAQNLFGATLTLSGRPLSQAPTWNRPSKTFRTHEETIASPPSSIGSHHDVSGLAMDKAQASTTSLNAHSDPVMQTSPSANSSKKLTKASPKLRGSTRPVHPSRGNLDLSDALGGTPTHQNQRPKSILDQEKGRIGRRSVLNARSTNQNLGDSRDGDETSGQVNSKTDRSSGLPMKASNKIQHKAKAGADTDGIRGDRPQILSIDLTDDQAETPRNQPLLDQPKTELIIKPRKKRGLLMMSERHPIRDPPPKSGHIKMGSGTRNSPSSSNTKSTDVSTSKRDKKTKSINARHNRADSPEAPPILAPRRKIMDWGSDADTNDDADDNSSHLRPRKRSFADDTFSDSANGGHKNSNLGRTEDDAATDKMPPPRLVKLGRRGINNKEVIGFIFDDGLDQIVNAKQKSLVREEPLPFEPNQGISQQQQQHQTKNNVCDDPVASETRQDAEPQPQSKDALGANDIAVLQRQNSEKPKPSCKETSIMIQSEEALSTVTTTTTKQHRSLIANPATRGRKAAKPSDAAGQMPICPLPTDSVGSLSLHQNPKKRNAQGDLDAGSVNPMPGFSRANGGPWSREAHDLFDFKRPS